MTEFRDQLRVGGSGSRRRKASRCWLRLEAEGGKVVVRGAAALRRLGEPTI